MTNREARGRAHGEARPDVPYYWRSVDWERLMADHPPPPRYATRQGPAPDDEKAALQEARALARVADAW